MNWKFACTTLLVLIGHDFVSSQQIPSTTTAAELWNPWTWFWPYAIASAEGFRDYYQKAQQATNELYQQVYKTNAFPWITGNWGNNPSQANQGGGGGQQGGQSNQGGSGGQTNQGTEGQTPQGGTGGQATGEEKGEQTNPGEGGAQTTQMDNTQTEVPVQENQSENGESGVQVQGNVDGEGSGNAEINGNV